MAASQDDPFAVNPYIAPEVQEPAESDNAATQRGVTAKWLVAVLLIETAMTLAMITLHSSSPRVRGINVLAIGNLCLSGLLSVIFAWFLGRRSSGPRVLLIAQLGNLFIWLTFAIIIHLRFGIRLTGEGSLLLTSFVASALLSLLANLASSGAFRSRISHSLFFRPNRRDPVRYFLSAVASFASAAAGAFESAVSTTIISIVNAPPPAPPAAGAP